MASRSDLVIRPVSNMVQNLSQYGRNLFTPPSTTIRGLKESDWYSPLQPVEPFAPRGTEPKGFQYWSGQNQNFTPRFDAEYTAADLKTLATYPLASICISSVKDSVCRAEWE